MIILIAKRAVHHVVVLVDDLLVIHTHFAHLFHLFWDWHKVVLPWIFGEVLPWIFIIVGCFREFLGQLVLEVLRIIFDRFIRGVHDQVLDRKLSLLVNPIWVVTIELTLHVLWSERWPSVDLRENRGRKVKLHLVRVVLDIFDGQEADVDVLRGVPIHHLGVVVSEVDRPVFHLLVILFTRVRVHLGDVDVLVVLIVGVDLVVDDVGAVLLEERRLP